MIAFLMFPVAVICAGLLVHRAMKRRWQPAGLVLLLPIACEGLAVTSALCLRRDWDGVELDAHATAGELSGVWRADDRRLVLRIDGTCVGLDGTTGTWSITDRGSEVRAGGSTWAVLRKHGQLALLPAQRVDRQTDPDEWNLHGMCLREPLEQPATPIPAP